MIRITVKNCKNQKPAPTVEISANTLTMQIKLKHFRSYLQLCSLKQVPFLVFYLLFANCAEFLRYMWPAEQKAGTQRILWKLIRPDINIPTCNNFCEAKEKWKQSFAWFPSYRVKCVADAECNVSTILRCCSKFLMVHASCRVKVTLLHTRFVAHA